MTMAAVANRNAAASGAISATREGVTQGGVSQAWARALSLTAELTREPTRTLAVVLEELAARFCDAPAIVSAQAGYSFAELAARARRYTRWARAQGYGPGVVVALLAPNSPDYFAAWVGVSRTGATVALLNTYLRGRALAHSLEVAGARALLVAPGLEASCEEAMEGLAPRPSVWRMAADGLDLAAYDEAPLSPWEGQGARLFDRALLIYTSGTTGLPKAANVSHARC